MSKIHELITEDTWTKAAYAETKYGRRVYINDPRAAKFCAMGWISKVYTPDGDLYNMTSIPEYQKLIDNINEGMPKDHGVGVGIWNDCSTFEQVKAKFKELDL